MTAFPGGGGSPRHQSQNNKQWRTVGQTSPLGSDPPPNELLTQTQSYATKAPAPTDVQRFTSIALRDHRGLLRPGFI